MKIDYALVATLIVMSGAVIAGNTVRNQRHEINFISIGEAANADLRKTVVDDLSKACPRLGFSEVLSGSSVNVRPAIKVDGILSNEVAIVRDYPVTREGDVAITNIDLSAASCVMKQKGQIVGYYANGTEYKNQTQIVTLAQSENDSDLALVWPNQTFKAQKPTKIIQLIN